MPDPSPLAPLLSALRDLSRWLDAERVPAMVIGGVAASLQGRPRTTRDVDVTVLIDEQQWGPFLESGKSFGFRARRRDALPFARKARVLLFRHVPSGIDLDVVLGLLSFEREAVGRAGRMNVGGVRLPIATPEDLIVMKAVAHRPRDIADIEGIVDAHPRLDTRRIRRCVRGFGEALDMPELEPEVIRLLRKGKMR